MTDTAIATTGTPGHTAGHNGVWLFMTDTASATTGTPGHTDIMDGLAIYD